MEQLVGMFLAFSYIFIQTSFILNAVCLCMNMYEHVDTIISYLYG